MKGRPEKGATGLAVLLAGGWVVVTVMVVMVFSRLPEPSLLAAGQWATLYAATLVVPLMWMIRLRRRTRALRLAHAHVPEAVVEELSRAGWSYLAIGYLSAIAAIMLVLFYAP